MPPKKSLIKRHEIQIAQRKRTCKNSGEVINAGEKCLIVHDGQYDVKTYCKTVALEMIESSKEKLDNLEKSLL